MWGARASAGTVIYHLQNIVHFLYVSICQIGMISCVLLISCEIDIQPLEKNMLDISVFKFIHGISKVMIGLIVHSQIGL